MRMARLSKMLMLAIGGMTLFGAGCFSTTTTQGLVQTGVQTVLQTLISLAVQSVVLSTST